jgi:hypothetical protein
VLARTALAATLLGGFVTFGAENEAVITNPFVVNSKLEAVAGDPRLIGRPVLECIEIGELAGDEQSSSPRRQIRSVLLPLREWNKMRRGQILTGAEVAAAMQAVCRQEPVQVRRSRGQQYEMTTSVLDAVSWRLSIVLVFDPDVWIEPRICFNDRGVSYVDIGSQLALGGSLEMSKLSLAGCPQFVSGGPQVSGGPNQSVRYVSEQSSEDRDEPIWQVVQNVVVPVLFLLTFGLIFVCDRYSDRLASYAVLGWGWAWLLVFVGLYAWRQIYEAP